MTRRRHPKTDGLSPIVVDEALSRRVRAFALTVGHRQAIARLGIGKATFDTAMGGGRMQRATHARLVEALDREQQTAEVTESGA